MTEIIASVMARGPQQALRSARHAAMAGADWVELRLDRWPAGANLSEVIEGTDLPVLVTCRMPRDHGEFEGTIEDRRILIEQAIAAGAQGVDLEDWEDWQPAYGSSLRLMIRSFHDFESVPDDLPAIRDRLLAQNANLAKIVVTVTEIADAAAVMDLLSSTDQEAEPTVAFAMGPTAFPTRVLSALLGSPFVYGSLAEGEETAPGQIPVSDLAGIYRVKSLNCESGIFGLLGMPAMHSFGPLLHNRALRKLDVDGVYLPFETARPLDVVRMLPARRLRGLSVTAPYKEEVLSLCHRLDSSAEVAVSANTLAFEAHGQVVGYNTDIAGVIGALERAGLSLPGEGQPGIVLGGGGAARAAAVALMKMGFGVTLLARSTDRLRGFAEEHGFDLAPLTEQELTSRTARVVVHATPVGMAGADEDPGCLFPGWVPSPDCHVLDMIYQPHFTPLLTAISSAGATPAFGLEMFLTQAAEQLQVWTGQTLSEAELRRYVGGRV